MPRGVLYRRRKGKSKPSPTVVQNPKAPSRFVREALERQAVERMLRMAEGKRADAL